MPLRRLCNKVVRPEDLCFTQDSISVTFKRPREQERIDNAVENIIQGRLSPTAFPKMNVVEFQHCLWSLDNRRLWVFKKAEVSFVTVELVAFDFGRGFHSLVSTSPYLYAVLSSPDFFPRIRGYCKTVFFMDDDQEQQRPPLPSTPLSKPSTPLSKPSTPLPSPGPPCPAMGFTDVSPPVKASTAVFGMKHVRVTRSLKRPVDGAVTQPSCRITNSRVLNSHRLHPFSTTGREKDDSVTVDLPIPPVPPPKFPPLTGHPIATKEVSCSSITVHSGDIVYVKVKGLFFHDNGTNQDKPCKKLHPYLRIMGPFKVVRKLNAQVVLLKLPHDCKLRPIFGLKHLLDSRCLLDDKVPETRMTILLVADTILKKRVARRLKKKKVWHFLVKWKTLPATEATWEPETIFVAYPHLLDQIDIPLFSNPYLLRNWRA